MSGAGAAQSLAGASVVRMHLGRAGRSLENGERMSDGMRSYYPSSGYLALAAGCIALAVGLPFSRPPATFYWTAAVFVGSYFAWRRFLRCAVDARHVFGRNPESLKSVMLSIEEIGSAKKGRFGILNLPGLILVDGTGNQVFLHRSAMRDPRVARVLPSGKTTD